jgi:hypothetical protein
MTESKSPIQNFYQPVLAKYPPEVQRLMIELLGEQSPQTFDLEAAIMKVAESIVPDGGES